MCVCVPGYPWCQLPGYTTGSTCLHHPGTRVGSNFARGVEPSTVKVEKKTPAVPGFQRSLSKSGGKITKTRKRGWHQSVPSFWKILGSMCKIQVRVYWDGDHEESVVRFFLWCHSWYRITAWTKTPQNVGIGRGLVRVLRRILRLEISNFQKFLLSYTLPSRRVNTLRRG